MTIQEIMSEIRMLSEILKKKENCSKKLYDEAINPTYIQKGREETKNDTPKGE